MILTDIMFKMTALKLMGLILLSLIVYGNCQLPGLQTFQSNSACHGTTNVTVNNMNVTCPTGHVVAVKSIQLGANLLSDNCPLYYNSSVDYDVCCTNEAGTDCLFPFNTNNAYHESCNGRQSCFQSTQHQQFFTACNSSYGTIEGAFSNYMTMEYYCIEEDKVVDMCTQDIKTQEYSEVYLWNQGFPNSSIKVSDTYCACSVETDNCGAMIDVYVIYKQLMEISSSNCSQSITIKDGDNNTLITWTCSDNSLTIVTDSVAATYIVIELNNNHNVSAGKFWLGFNASEASNITVSCPAVQQQNCVQTTSTTTETTSTTAATTTTNATTTVEPETSTAITSTTDDVSSTVMQTSAHTEVTGGMTAPSSGDDLRVALIVLSVLAGLLLLAVIILACLLYRKCRKKDQEDAEMADSEKDLLDFKQGHENMIQSIPPISTTAVPKVNKEDIKLLLATSSDAAKEGTRILSGTSADLAKKDTECQTSLCVERIETFNFNCQVNLLLADIQTLHVACQTDTENLEFNQAEQKDFGCQVIEIKVEITDTAVNTEMNEDTNLKLEDKDDQDAKKDEVYLTSTKETGIQTKKIKTKNKKSQSDQLLEEDVAESSSLLPQADKQPAEKEEVRDTLVGAQVSMDQMSSFRDFAVVDNKLQISSSAKRKKSKRKQKEMPKPSDQLLSEERTDSVNSNSVPPTQMSTEKSKDSDVTLLSDTEETRSDESGAKMIYVAPQSEAVDAVDSDDDIPEILKRTSKIHKVLVNSFFAQERKDELMVKKLLRSTKKRKGKRKDTKQSKEIT